MDKNQNQNVVQDSSNGAKKEKKKHYGWRFALTFVGGMLFMVVAIGGAAAIVGTVTPTKNVVTMFGGNPDELLGEDYQNSSILNMVMSLSQQKFETLGDINEVTPMVEKLIVETINPILKENIHYEFDWDELKTKPFVKSESGRPEEEVDSDEILSDYIANAMKDGITLASFMEGNGEMNNVLKLFLYPTIDDGYGDYTFNYDEPYSLSTYIESGSQFFTDIINQIKVSDVIDTTNDPFLSQMANWKVTEFSSEKIRTLKIGCLFSTEQLNSNILLRTIKENDWSIDDIANYENISSLKINQVIDMTSASSLMQAIGKFTISDLSTKDLTKLIKIKDIYPDATEGIMFALADHYIADLQDEETIMSLKLSDIMDISKENILYSFRNDTLKELTSKGLDDIKIKDIFSESEINANIVLKAIVANNENVTVADLAKYETLSKLSITSFLPKEDIANSKVLTALVDKNATIETLSECINNLHLSDLINYDEDDETSVTTKIVKALDSYTICEIGDHFSELKISDLFNVDDSSSQILKAIKNETLASLSERLHHITIGDVVDISGTIFDKEGIRETEIEDVTKFESALKENLELGDLVDIDSSSPKVLQFLENTIINDIPERVSTMTFGDMIEIDSESPQILKSLEGCNLFGSGTDNIEYVLTNLKFNQIYTEEDCSSGIIKTLWDNNGGGDFLISELTSKINDLKLTDLLEDKIYADPNTKRISNTWWYLLTEEGETFTAEEKYYTLKNGSNYKFADMDKIVTNMEYHMKNESIFNLIEADFINVDAGNISKLETKVNPTDPNSKRLGDLTISEFTNYALGII